MNHPTRRASWLDLPNLDVAIKNFIAVVLQDDMPRASIGESLQHAILALRQRRIHSRRSEIELHDLLAVEPMLAVIATKNDARGVPLPNRLQSLFVVRRDQVVQRAGAVRRQLVVV